MNNQHLSPLRNNDFYWRALFVKHLHNTTQAYQTFLKALSLMDLSMRRNFPEKQLTHQNGYHTPGPKSLKDFLQHHINYHDSRGS